MGEPGTLYAAEAGVASIEHATELSDETMKLMTEKQIPAVPTFAIFNYFAQHAPTPAVAAREKALLDVKIREFKRQIAARIPFAEWFNSLDAHAANKVNVYLTRSGRAILQILSRLKGLFKKSLLIGGQVIGFMLVRMGIS